VTKARNSCRQQTVARVSRTDRSGHAQATVGRSAIEETKSIASNSANRKGSQAVKPRTRIVLGSTKHERTQSSKAIPRQSAGPVAAKPVASLSPSKNVKRNNCSCSSNRVSEGRPHNNPRRQTRTKNCVTFCNRPTPAKSANSDPAVRTDNISSLRQRIPLDNTSKSSTASTNRDLEREFTS